MIIVRNSPNLHLHGFFNDDFKLIGEMGEMSVM